MACHHQPMKANLLGMVQSLLSYYVGTNRNIIGTNAVGSVGTDFLTSCTAYWTGLGPFVSAVPLDVAPPTVAPLINVMADYCPTTSDVWINAGGDNASCRKFSIALPSGFFRAYAAEHRRDLIRVDSALLSHTGHLRTPWLTSPSRTQMTMLSVHDGTLYIDVATNIESL